MYVIVGNTKYSREDGLFYKDGLLVNEIPNDVAYEFERQDRKHQELLGMNGKTVEVSYDEKYGYFIKYKNGDENVILDPVRYSY